MKSRNQTILFTLIFVPLSLLIFYMRLTEKSHLDVVVINDTPAELIVRAFDTAGNELNSITVPPQQSPNSYMNQADFSIPDTSTTYHFKITDNANNSIKEVKATRALIVQESKWISTGRGGVKAWEIKVE